MVSVPFKERVRACATGRRRRRPSLGDDKPTGTGSAGTETRDDYVSVCVCASKKYYTEKEMDGGEVN